MNKLELVQFVKFCIVGVSNTLITYAVYSICIFIGAHYLIANFIGFLAGVLNAYYWSDKFVFTKKKGEIRDSIKTLLKLYIAYGSTCLILASVLLYLYVDMFHFSEYIAQILVLVVTTPLNYAINKYWAFKTKTYDKK